MTYRENDYGVYGRYLYEPVLTRYNFSFNGLPYQPKPWPKAFYNYPAENNYASSFPDITE